MPAMKHIHKYYRMPNQKWGCGYPDCSHYMPGNVEDLIVGKSTICWECGRKTQVTRAMTLNLNLTYPKCEHCIPVQIEANKRTLADMMEFIEQQEQKAREEQLDKKFGSDK